MFLKKLDMLSPPITLFFRGDNQHSSIISGILSIIAYGGIFGFGIYYSLQFINKDNPSSYFFNRYVEDAGDYPVNASSIFHFIQMMRTDTNEPKPTDFDAFRIIGLEDPPDVYIRDNNLSKYNHWLYGPCNNNSDTEGIGYLINFKYYEQSGCIRKYYDKNKKMYYGQDNENFRWPLISKGVSNPQRTFYGVIMEKCRNDEVRSLSGDNPCKSEQEIDGIISSSMVNFYLIDHYADVLNYKKPFTKYLYSLQSGIFLGSICQNHISFNPAIMNTHNGIFMDNVVQETSYFYDQNEKATVLDEVKNEAGELIMTTDKNGNIVPKTTGMIICFYFWMQNRMQYYERIYQRLQDVLGDIGGLGNIILMLAELINFLVCHYIILIDTEDLALNLEEINYKGKKTLRRPTIFERMDRIMYPPKRQFNRRRQFSTTKIDIYENFNNQQPSSNYQRLVNNGIDVWKKNIDKDKEEIKDLDLKEDNKVMKFIPKKKKKKLGNLGKMIQNYNRNQINIQHNDIKESYTSTNDNLKKKKKINNNITNNKNKINKKQGFNWFKYIWYVINCGRNNPKINSYVDFRRKLISEESIIQDHLNIYKLLQFNENKNNAIEIPNINIVPN